VSAPLLWITDPWETLDHPRDTTLRLIEEGLALGLESHWCDVRTIRWENGAGRADVRRVEAIYPGRAASSFRLSEPTPAAMSGYSRAIYRTDPPVDLAYIHPLQIIALEARRAGGLEIVNPAGILLEANEKLEAALLGELMPESIASSRVDCLLAFAEREGRAVLKPLHQAQSKGVMLLEAHTPEEGRSARKTLMEATEGGTRPVILQRYLPGILEGETRLWFLNGKLLAAVRKKPRTGEFRIDMDQGGSVTTTQLTVPEKRAATRIGTLLRKRRVRLAAVDLIESKVTDFNLTSPGLIVQMEQVLGQNLARPIVESLSKPWK
jgi:glutathione synthase